MNNTMQLVQCSEHIYKILELECISFLRHEDPVESLLEVVVDRCVHPFGDLHESRLPGASLPMYVGMCDYVDNNAMHHERCVHGAGTIRVCE